jgi:hypothetical protein
MFVLLLIQFGLKILSDFLNTGETKYPISDCSPFTLFYVSAQSEARHNRADLVADIFRRAREHPTGNDVAVIPFGCVKLYESDKLLRWVQARLKYVHECRRSAKIDLRLLYFFIIRQILGAQVDIRASVINRGDFLLKIFFNNIHIYEESVIGLGGGKRHYGFFGDLGVKIRLVYYLPCGIDVYCEFASVICFKALRRRCFAAAKTAA